MKTALVLATLALCGCYAEGRSHLLLESAPEYFLTMKTCESEAASRSRDGSPRYAGYECRYKFGYFTLEKRLYENGRFASAVPNDPLGIRRSRREAGDDLRSLSDEEIMKRLRDAGWKIERVK